MILIVDGYNLILHEDWPEQRGSLEKRRERLVHLLAGYRQCYALKRVALVFDGRAGVAPSGQQIIHKRGVQIIYATCSGKADQKIVNLCKKLSPVVVVTADRQLRKRVKGNKARVLLPKDFIPQLLRLPQRPSPTPKPLPPKNDEIDEWLDIFDLEAEISIPVNGTKLPPIPPAPVSDESSKSTTESSSESLSEISVEEWMEWMGLSEEEDV